MKKTPLQHFAILVSTGFVLWGVFFVSSVHAASPYTDQFENYNSEGWLAPSGGGTCGYFLPVATTSGYTGAGVEMKSETCFTGFGHLWGMYHSGGFTSIGGYRLFFKFDNFSGIFGPVVTFGFCFLTAPCSNGGYGLTGLGLNLSGTSYNGTGWHYVDVTFQPVGTTTLFNYYVDGNFNSSQEYATSTLMTASGVFVTTSGGTSGYQIVLDNLTNEFATPPIQSQIDLQNQSFYISTSTTQGFCNGTFATSTGLFSDIANGFSYGMCTVATFLFVPNTNIVSQFSSLNGVLPTKIPFSYYYDFSSILNGQSASSSANFSPMTVNLASTGVASTSPWGNVLSGLGNFSFLSTTTIMQYISQSTYDLLFLLMRSAIWFAVLFHIYHRIRPKHATAV